MVAVLRKMNLLILVAGVLATTTLVHADVTLNGSGASFPAPLYLRWASDFHKTRPEVTVNYEGVGSGAGVTSFLDGITDFGASDVAMTDSEIAKASGNILMLPVTAGTIVLAYNVPGIPGELKLSREAYVGILLGTVKSWNDPAIAGKNPEAKLPNLPITVVSRSDGSGTTAVFTAHVAAISQEFAAKVGSGKSVSWPVGVAVKGNDGVTSLIKQTPGAIGYIEYGYALNNHMSMAALENKSGRFITPTIESGAATLASVTLPGDLRAFITDPEGANDYPVATFTWLLVRKTYNDAAKAAAVKSFVNYGLTKGQDDAPNLGYISLPEPVVERSKAAVATVN